MRGGHRVPRIGCPGSDDSNELRTKFAILRRNDWCVRCHPHSQERTSNRDARGALGGFDIKDFFDHVVWPQHNRRGDKAVFVTLDGSDHRRLGRG